MPPRHLTDQELELLRFHLRNAVWKEPAPCALIFQEKYCGEGHDLMCALQELAQRRRKDRPGNWPITSRLTQTLIAMQIGESVLVPEATQGAWSAARRTARKQLGIPDARFHIESTSPGWQRVRRGPNGGPQHPRKHDGTATHLAKMKIGDTIWIDVARSTFPDSAKILARKEMSYDKANWRARKLNSGKWRIRRFR